MRFAHIADIHLGFQKHESLQDIEKKVFEGIIDRCISEKVDFVLIPGDMFHVNIPEMRVQKFAFGALRRLYEKGIPAYVVYGSHDFSPVSDSVIDLLEKAGYITKVTIPTSNDDGTIALEFLVDEKTGVKIVGFSGLKTGKDVEWYEKLDRENLEAEPGFKIFLFHGGVAEMKTDAAIDGDHMPLSLMPRGFAYYAGGHMHKYNHQSFPGYAHVVYPGTPFAGYHADLEENAAGQQRGFVLVDFGEKVENVEFIPVENTKYELIDIRADNRISESVNEELVQRANSIDPSEKLVIVKIHGELAAGKTADVNTADLRERFADLGALEVKVSRNSLTSKEYTISAAKGENSDEIEANTFKENIGQLRFSQQKLVGDSGVRLARELLHELGQGQLANERNEEYQARVQRSAMATLGVDV